MTYLNLMKFSEMKSGPEMKCQQKNKKYEMILKFRFVVIF